jgi:hypothetical protein
MNIYIAIFRNNILVEEHHIDAESRFYQIWMRKLNSAICEAGGIWNGSIDTILKNTKDGDIADCFVKDLNTQEVDYRDKERLIIAHKIKIYY